MIAIALTTSPRTHPKNGQETQRNWHVSVTDGIGLIVIYLSKQSGKRL